MKNKERTIRIVFLVISILVVGGIVAFILNFRLGRNKETISVGAVFIGNTEDNAWNESNYTGIKLACDRYSCRLYSQTNVPEEQELLESAVSKLAAKGCSCIFLTSYGYGNVAEDIVKKYPKIAFYFLSGDVQASNCASYFARMYQVRYLAGIAAGAATESNILGFITSMSIPETVRSINAYALGARKADPSAKVLVKFTGSWDDREAEESAAQMLADAGADVITFHEDKPYSIDLADEIGLFTTGYDHVSGTYSEKFLTAAVFNWDIIYTRILDDYLSGRANFSNDYWLGLEDGAVSLHPFSETVNGETKKLIASEEERIKNRRDVFSGVIYDNNGNLRCNENERISDKELFYNIDWYVEGVEIYE